MLEKLLGGSIGDLFTRVMDTIKLNPEQKAQVQLAMLQHETDLQKLQEDYDSKLQDIAGQNIRAEEGSGDKYVSRARPSFIYVMLGIMVANFVVFPLAHKTPLEFPEALYWLFGSCMLGYTGARTWEKVGAGGIGSMGFGKRK